VLDHRAVLEQLPRVMEAELASTSRVGADLHDLSLGGARRSAPVSAIRDVLPALAAWGPSWPARTPRLGCAPGSPQGRPEPLSNARPVSLDERVRRGGQSEHDLPVARVLEVTNDPPLALAGCIVRLGGRRGRVARSIHLGNLRGRLAFRLIPACPPLDARGDGTCPVTIQIQSGILALATDQPQTDRITRYQRRRHCAR
jgi:hypothetical protein